MQTTANRLKAHARTYDLPSIPALIAYLHGTAGFPVRSTWLAAIKRGAYASWPGLTYTLAARYCPNADETIRGHMAQPRQHIRSTQRLQAASATSLPLQPDAGEANSIELHELPINSLFTDDTGRFHPRSRSGNQYIMVALHSNSNAILIRPFATKKDAHRIAAYTDIYTRLATTHQPPALHIMDNEASAAFQHAIAANNCKLQLVPPHVHRRNAAERAIRTFKDHFLAILAGTDPTFPADRWDLLLPHAELTLNLLRPSNTPATAASAWHALFGNFNFDATPIGPAGSRVLIHNKASLRQSWDFRAQDGFYIGPALQHYRCYRVLTKTSRMVIISDAIRFRHHKLPSPRLTTEDKIIHALHAINTTIAHTTPAPSDMQLQAINTLRAVLRDYQNRPTRPETPPGVPPSMKPTTPPHPPDPGVQPTAPPPGVQPSPANPNPTPHHEHWTLVPARGHNTAHMPVPQTHNHEPIAARTRSRGTDVYYTLLAEHAHDDDGQCEPIAAPVLDATTGTMLEHRHLRRHPAYKQVWDTSYANELGRLCQGIGEDPTDPTRKRVDGTDTFKPIRYQDIPLNRRNDITYTRVVCEVRPQKADPNRTRITIGGNRICYPGDTGTKTGSIETVKLLLNSTISTPGARFACFDISNFYLGTPLDRPEYVRIKLSAIPHEFIHEYNLTNYEDRGWVYFEINKGVYGLKQAGKLANDLLTTRLDNHGYYQCATTPGLWRH